MSHIFVSYAREDQAYVDRLVEQMRTYGVPVWIDAQLRGGARWYREIEEGLDASSAMVLIMSHESKDSQWVENELLRAMRKGIPVRPLLLDGDPWLALESSQYVDVSGGRLPGEPFYSELRTISSEPRRSSSSESATWLDASDLVRRTDSPGGARYRESDADFASLADEIKAAPYRKLNSREQRDVQGALVGSRPPKNRREALLILNYAKYRMRWSRPVAMVVLGVLALIGWGGHSADANGLAFIFASLSAVWLILWIRGEIVVRRGAANAWKFLKRGLHPR